MIEDNQRQYDSQRLLNWYKRQSTLMPAELTVFNELKDQLTGFDVLDIGIGSGRTTAYLSNRSRTYVGIDYSPQLINYSAKQFPETDLRLMDARDLSAFKEGSFHLVNFSFNGIDYVTVDDRFKIMKEVYRVLKPDGIFFFSTHNKTHPGFNKKPWRNADTSAFINFKTFLRLLPFLPRHLAKKKQEVFTNDYAVINDCAHSYGLLTFYSTPAFLRTQLQQAGFEKILLRAHSGKKVTDNLLDSWIFVTCKRSEFQPAMKPIN